ncbi:DUF1682-domain-containing protein [Gloeophyllum trabeum ATCC 11539]|uniref:DUF1682-domain-containing protein n=1 Tax=Gloeophyllum trabeum (strain ATCC 11539 / FP-39264 / Madison 617) TaxID=670483 RepID=S7QHI9_GLOTA|nr:DUF1682-domain-containing protein [Gloeophyllum trabeum ATCC 11539]EPQ59261.1 DUF1682-domain-containing protein [Gloeophyllum trabeum ATCC 11539]
MSLARLLQGITPPPPVVPAEYNGLEYRWKNFVFRPAEFKIEGLAALGIILYLVLFWIGKNRNAQRASKWLDAHLPFLSTQFSKPTNEGLTQDGYSDFFNFSTGRRRVERLHTVFKLRPRHDPVQYLGQILWGLTDLKYNPKDEILLDFELSSGPDFVWAVVAKDELEEIRKERWDLTFTKTTDNAALPASLTVMSEFADVTDNLLKPINNFSLVKALSDPEILPYFRSLSITDQPQTRPNSAGYTRSKHILLALKAPPPSSAQATLPIVSAAFKLIDNLDRAVTNLRPETRTKLRKVREEVDRELRVAEEKEKQEEAIESKQAAKKKAEEERLSKLSAAEQKKALERERKRSIRKKQGKMVRK